MFGNKENKENNEEKGENTQEIAEKSAKKYKIDEKTAEIEFNNFCEMWSIDNDTSEMNEEDKAGFEEQKSILVKAFRKGLLILDRENRSLVYTISERSEKAGERIILKGMKGSDLMAADRYKENDSMHKTQAIIASMSNVPTSYISSLDMSDLNVLQACTILFMQG